MQIYALISLINCIIALSLGLFLVTVNLHHPAHRRLALVNFSIALWDFGYFQWQEALVYNSAILWVRILTLGSILLPPLFLYWALTFIGELKKYRRLLIFTIFSTIFFLVFTLTPLMIPSVAPYGGFPFWPKPGIFYHFFLAFQFIFIMGFGFYRLIYAYRTTQGINKQRLKIIIPGMLFGFICGLTNFPYWYGIPIPPIGNFLIVVYPLSLSWAILQYRFVDVKFAIEGTLVRIIKIALLELLFISLGLAYSIVLHESINLWGYVIFAVCGAVIIVLIDDYVEQGIQLAIKNLVFGKEVPINDSYAVFKRNLAKVSTFNQLVERTREFLQEKMNVSNAWLLLNPKSDFQPNLTNDVSIKINYQKVINLTTEDTNIYIAEELDQALNEEMIAPELTEKMQKLVSFLEQNNLSALLVLPRADTKGDILLIGTKQQNVGFTVQEVKIFESLTYHLSIVVDNVLLYEKEKEFNEKLQGEIDKATAELKSTYDQLKTIDKMKDYIIDISSHELRTPATIIKSYLWLVLQGKKGPINEDQKSALTKAFDSNERLIQLVNDMLDVSRIEGGRLQLRLSKFNVREVLEEIIDQMKIKAVEKNLTLRLEYQLGDQLKEINSDKEKFEEIIMNLVSNSIKYTQEGSITLIAKSNQESSLIIAVSDTGVGIPKEDMGRLFSKFYRTEQTLVQVPSAGGTGLGLFITKSLVSALGGTVSVISEVNKGSTFTINIPTNFTGTN